MSDNNGKELCKRFDKMFSKREPLSSLWQELAMQFYPERADFTSEITLGDEFASHLFDSSPVLARRDLGNAFSSMLRPRGQPWFRCTVTDDDIVEKPGVKKWLENSTNIMRRALYERGANFVRATKQGDHDYAAFGQCVLSVEENGKKDGLLFRDWHIRDCVWAESHEGTIDTLYRRMKLSARQIEQKFPKATLHQSIKDALEKDPDQEFTVAHVMLPSADYENGKEKKPYTSIYFDTLNNLVLREGGSDTFRYIIPRWQMLGSSVYAASPAAMTALADSRMVQSIARILIEAGEKSVDPPMVAVEEAIRGEINLYSGGVTWVDRAYDEKKGGLALRPVELGNNVMVGAQLLDRVRSSLADAWYLSKLRMPRSGGKTAYETSQLVEEFIRESIPLFEPMETEYNLPILDAAFDVLWRNQGFGPMKDTPKELSGREVTFAFANPLQDAIEKNKVMQFQTTMAIIGGASQIDPAAQHEVDISKAARDAVKGSGAPLTWLSDAGAVDAKVAESAKQAGLEKAEQTAGVGAEALQHAAAAALSLSKANDIATPALPGGY
jgi:hypothetical protein